MTETGGLTVRDLLPSHLKKMDEAVKGELERDASLKTAGFPLGLSGKIADQTADAVAKTLDVDVIELLARGWAKAWELHEYSEAAGKHPPNEVDTLFLGEHDLRHELHPTAVLSFGAFSRITMEFVVEVAAHLKTAQLTVKGGKITDVGECTGSVSAEFKFAGIPLHDALESHPLVLVRSFHLPQDGLKIP
jgi:hypothetical protein